MRTLLLLAGLAGGMLASTPSVGAQCAESVGHDSGEDSRADEECPAEDEVCDRFADSIVVTGSVDGVEAERVATSIEVLDAEEIEARQATSVAELLATATGVTVARSGSPGQLTSVFTRGTESDHTLVLWNGIELNNPYFGGFNWAFQATEGLARVEIARGPFSALYGSDAVGGVVHMISGRRRGVGARLEGGDAGYGRVGIEAGFGGERWQLDLFGHARRGEGELENDFYDSDGLVTRFDWSISEGASLGFVARANDSETGIPRTGGVATPERRIAWRERQLALPFRVERGDWRLDAQISTVGYASRFSDPDDPFAFTEAQTDSRSSRGRVTISHASTLGGRLSAGFEHETVEVDDSSVFGVALDGAEQTTDAVFAQWHREAGSWIVDIGLRYDDNDVYGSETSPRIAVSRELGARGRVFASYGRSFRAPSIGELFFPFSGNPELQPERGESGELGYALRGDRYWARAVLFENRLTNLIDFDFVNFTNINVGEARTRGVELAAGAAAPTWSWRWNATYLEAEDRRAGLDLLRRPGWSSNVVVTLQPERWNLSAVGRYVGAREDIDTVAFERRTNGSYTAFDFAARFRWTRRVSPYARVANAFDRTHEEVLGFPVPGRTWTGGLTWRYGARTEDAAAGASS